MFGAIRCEKFYHTPTKNCTVTVSKLAGNAESEFQELEQLGIDDVGEKAGKKKGQKVTFQVRSFSKYGYA